MKTDDLLKLLAQLDRRLATIRDETQHTLGRLDRLRQDLERLRWSATGATSDNLPVAPGEPD